MVETNHNAMVALATLKNAGFETFFAGGAVRDFALGLEPHDWDLVTSATPEQVDELFSTSKCKDYFKSIESHGKINC